jgi:hypothetical protein
VEPVVFRVAPAPAPVCLKLGSDFPHVLKKKINNFHGFIKLPCLVKPIIKRFCKVNSYENVIYKMLSFIMKNLGGLVTVHMNWYTRSQAKNFGSAPAKCCRSTSSSTVLTVNRICFSRVSRWRGVNRKVVIFCVAGAAWCWCGSGSATLVTSFFHSFSNKHVGIFGLNGTSFVCSHLRWFLLDWAIF